MRIKVSSFKEIYVYLFMIFIITKVWRAFSGSEEHGGIWNYIQVFYVLIGIVVFLKFINSIKREPALILLSVYSMFALTISVLSVKNFNTTSLFELIKIPFAGAIAIVFYSYGYRKETLEDHKIMIKATFYISAAILCYQLGRYMLAGGIRSSGAGAVADVYYILGLLPFILAITEKKRQIIPIVVTAVSIFISQKRAGFIALLGLIILYYLLGSGREKRMRNTVGRVLVLLLLLLGGYYLMIYMDSKFNLNLFLRMRMLETDGGSGRSVIWGYVSDGIKKSKTMHLIFGHGINGVKNLVGTHAHNDFLEIIYNYGIIALGLYVSFFFLQIKNAVRMIKEGYSHSAEFIASLFVSLCIAVFSYYVIDATYVICGCFTQVIFLADWRNSRLQSQNNIDSTRIP